MSFCEQERTLQEPDRAIYIFLRTQIEANPTGTRKDVMGLGFARGDDFVTHALGKRNVHEAIAVDVADFASAETKFDPTEPMRRHLDAVPAARGCADPAIGS